MIKVAGLILISLLLIIFLKQTKREFAFLLSIGCAVILLAAVAEDFITAVKRIYDLSSGIGDISTYISLMIKILCISLVAQFVVDLCRDAGENALASQTEIASKILILMMTLPLFETVISIVTGLLK